MIAAVASNQLGDADGAQRYREQAAQTLAAFRQRFGVTDGKSYFARPDVTHALTQLQTFAP
jgi:hypothetical protein